jgi:hypothetical protein
MVLAPRSPRFRSAEGKAAVLSEKPMNRIGAYRTSPGDSTLRFNPRENRRGSRTSSGFDSGSYPILARRPGRQHKMRAAMARSPARILWSTPRNPPASVARALGMEARRFSRALRKIKAASDLSGTDRVVIYSDGSVTDEHGEPLGNLYDEN